MNQVRFGLVPRRHLRRLQRQAVRALRAALPGVACRQAARQGSSCHCLLQCQTEVASRCWTHWPAPFCSALLTAGPNVRRTRPIALRSAPRQDALAEATGPDVRGTHAACRACQLGREAPAEPDLLSPVRLITSEELQLSTENDCNLNLHCMPVKRANCCQSALPPSDASVPCNCNEASDETTQQKGQRTFSS